MATISRSMMIVRTFLLLVGLGTICPSPTVAAAREQWIPVVSRALESRSNGTVAYLIVTFDTRADRSGLTLQFKAYPGRFSRTAQTSIEQAIRRCARSLNLSTESWTVVLSVPYPEITMYGEELSGMVGITVAAMATGRTIVPGLVMTGTITPEGRIGPVGTKPLKLPPTGRGHLRQVIVAKEQLLEELNQPLPGKMQVLSLNSVSQAFHALTEATPVTPQ